ncbi:MAG: lysophospholipid acyltransferase family protein [Promethearchaeota archaeon]
MIAKAIPFPKLSSWMHERVHLPAESREECRIRHARQEWEMKLADRILGPFLRWFSSASGTKKWALYRVCMGVAYLFFRAHNRLEVRGIENIPKSAIFVANHRGEQDVVIFMAAFYSAKRQPVGVFTAVGDGLIADTLEEALGFVPRRGVSVTMVEKMVRAVLKRNRYFAIWPEGTASPDGRLMHGFSGIVRAYSVLNSRRDVVPFVPVMMRGNESYWWGERRRPKKVLVEFLKPVFVPRGWLRRPSEGGKTPREIIDALMLLLARKLGQVKLEVNPLLERRRKGGGKPW